MFEENRKIFLGVDGGQSSTKAVVADEIGNILGIGFGSALNHGNLADGREKLRNALVESVNNALNDANLPLIERTVFDAAHCGMTGGAEFKEEIVRQTLKAKKLFVGHDALTALYGATAGKPGIIVIAGTGSIVFGINETGQTARAGGLGYVFADEGSGFWLAVETIKLAIAEQDFVVHAHGLREMVLDYFAVGEIRELTNAFYNEQISRDKIAAFAETVFNVAANGNQTLENLIQNGAKCLVANVKGAAKQLNFAGNFQVSPVGGLFQNALMNRSFREILHTEIPESLFVEPLFNPATGAIILAYKSSRVEISESILSNLRISYERKNSAR